MPGLWTIDSQAMSLIRMPIGLVGLLLWSWTAPPVLRRYALLSRRLFGPAATSALTARIRKLTEARSTSVNPTPARWARLERLTPREREVLALIAEGRPNAAIAARLYITEK